MRKVDILRAWKDPLYRLSLSEAERARLPEHPAAPIDLRDEDLGSALGGDGPTCTTTVCCTYCLTC